MFARPVGQNLNEVECGASGDEVKPAVRNDDILEALQYQRCTNPLQRGHRAIRVYRVRPRSLRVNFDQTLPQAEIQHLR